MGGLRVRVCVCVFTELRGLKEGFSSWGVQNMPMKAESILESGSCLKIQTDTIRRMAGAAIHEKVLFENTAHTRRHLIFTDKGTAKR